MAQTLRYKGYEGSIDVSAEDDVLHGQVLFINDVVSYEGETIPELRQSFESAVDDYLELCEKTGTEADKPFKGTFNVRVTPALHRDAAVRAKREGCSLNDIVCRALDAYLHPMPATETLSYLHGFRFELEAKPEPELSGVTPQISVGQSSQMEN